MKKIYFKQQRPLDYMPLRAGLGYITPEELVIYALSLGVHKRLHDVGLLPTFAPLCPKLYTTRTHKLQGEYYVVEGSRFKAKPVEPRIEFQVGVPWELNLSNITVRYDNKRWNKLEYIFPYNFSELDLGIRGAIFSDLRNELLNLNPKATTETPFWINKLEPIGDK